MPSGGCNQLRATELTVGAWPSTVGVASHSASHRSHYSGEAVK
jgi:hypothetical protein